MFSSNEKQACNTIFKGGCKTWHAPSNQRFVLHFIYNQLNIQTLKFARGFLNAGQNKVYSVTRRHKTIKLRGSLQRFPISKKKSFLLTYEGRQMLFILNNQMSK